MNFTPAWYCPYLISIIPIITTDQKFVRICVEVHFPNISDWSTQVCHKVVRTVEDEDRIVVEAKCNIVTIGGIFGGSSFLRYVGILHQHGEGIVYIIVSIFGGEDNLASIRWVTSFIDFVGMNELVIVAPGGGTDDEADSDREGEWQRWFNHPFDLLYIIGY